MKQSCELAQIFLFSPSRSMVKDSFRNALHTRFSVLLHSVQHRIQQVVTVMTQRKLITRIIARQ